MKYIYWIVISAIILAVFAGFYFTSEKVISSFSTSVADRSPEQLRNITRAAKAINGIYIKQGEVFSMNKILGPCTLADGYVPAPTIVRGELQPSVGGGICQVSSTLYNAALLANLEIVSRTPHSGLVSSVPPGRDAAVAFGISDLCLRNNTKSSVRISAKLTKDRLIVSIMGKSKDFDNVEIKCNVRQDIPQILLSTPALKRDFPRGEQTHGISADTYREVYRNGKIISRELVSSDRYTPRVRNLLPGN